MKSYTLWGAIIIVLTAVLYWSGQACFDSKNGGLQIADANNRAQVEIGILVYAKNCASCYGVNLEGQLNW